MAGKTLTRTAWLMAAVLFGATGYAGYRFINEVSSTAGDIHSNVDAPGDLSIDLQVSGPVAPVGNLDNLIAAEDFSQREDLRISGGDYAWDGALTLRLEIENQSGVPMDSAYINTAAYDSTAAPLIQKIGIPIRFGQTLQPGERAVVDVPLEGDWAAVQEQGARLLVKLVSASGRQNGNTVDYPQSGQSVVLNQADAAPPLPEIGADIRDSSDGQTESSANGQSFDIQNFNGGNGRAEQ